MLYKVEFTRIIPPRPRCIQELEKRCLRSPTPSRQFSSAPTKEGALSLLEHSTTHARRMSCDKSLVIKKITLTLLSLLGDIIYWLLPLGEIGIE